MLDASGITRIILSVVVSLKVTRIILNVKVMSPEITGIIMSVKVVSLKNNLCEGCGTKNSLICKLLE